MYLARAVGYTRSLLETHLEASLHQIEPETEKVRSILQWPLIINSLSKLNWEKLLLTFKNEEGAEVIVTKFYRENE